MNLAILASRIASPSGRPARDIPLLGCHVSFRHLRTSLTLFARLLINGITFRL